MTHLTIDEIMYLIYLIEVLSYNSASTYQHDMEYSGTEEETAENYEYIDSCDARIKNYKDAIQDTLQAKL